MLTCECWIKNPDEYFLEGSVKWHMEKHPLEKECVNHLIHHKFSGFKNGNLREMAKAYLTIKEGTNFENFKYMIEYEKTLPEEIKIHAFIHEITHAHYLNIFNVNWIQEEWITEHAKEFLEKNKSFCKDKYLLATNHLWEEFFY